MSRWQTWLVVGAVGALAVLAAADALRGHGEPEASPRAAATTTTTPPPLTLREKLRQAAITGFVLYSDQNCVLHSLLLPGMETAVVRHEDGRPEQRCSFTVAAGRILPGDVVPSPGGGQLARCRRGRIRVWETESGAPIRTVRGCAPAWDADGRLTYARSEEVRQDDRVLYSPAELHRIARRYPTVATLGPHVPFRVRVRALAWLDRLHLAMSLRVRIEGVEPQYFVVLLDGEEIVTLDTAFRVPMTKLVVSPAGSFVADEQGTLLLTQGRSLNLPAGVPRPRSVAFSPDEGWLAAATGRSVFLVGTPRNPGRIIRLPVSARDLVWEPVSRGSVVGPPIRR
jgi:hypothetical protein